MLSQLLRERDRAKRAQRRKLISAILLGGNVVVGKGKDVGGTFRRTPLCRDEAARLRHRLLDLQRDAARRFDVRPCRRRPRLVPKGADPKDYRVACTEPGGAQRRLVRLETIARSEPFPGTLGVGISLMYGFDLPTADTPWLVPQDHYRGRCERVNGADVLMISPVAGARVLTPSPTPEWGLHLLDGNVALGNLVELVGKQGKRYVKRERRR